jgi:putative iron-dependent peroxidase
MPFGNPGKGEFGTYYIGYCATPSVTEEMLENMFIGLPPGNTDRILDFSTAVTGCLFFAPCADFLDDPPGPPGAAAVASVPVAAGASGAASVSGAAGASGAGGPAQAADGSLGIGSLRG